MRCAIRGAGYLCIAKTDGWPRLKRTNNTTKEMKGMAISGENIILVEKKPEGITILTINRPERGNRLSYELVNRMEEVWTDFRFDSNQVVAVVTGAGDDFMLGPDLYEFGKAERGEAERLEPRPWGFPRFYPYELWKPVICAFNGSAFCGGFMLGDQCDIRIAAEDAVFGIKEGELGTLAPWLGGLTRSFNLGQALALALWGGEYTAQRMYEMGWIHKVVPKDKVMDEAMRWARRALEMNPYSLRIFKQMIYRGQFEDIARSREFAYAVEQGYVGAPRENVEEGIRAYIEGRKPKFKKQARWFWHGPDPTPDTPGFTGYKQMERWIP